MALKEALVRDLDRIQKENFTNGYRAGYIEYQGVCLPQYYNEFADAIENLEIRDDDVWICSYPKTGTTWTQEMIWCIANDLDFDTAAKVIIQERFPFLEHSSLFDWSTIIKNKPRLLIPELVLDSVKLVKNLPSPRFVKTHLPFNLLPRQLRTGETKARLVYVARNPKDTCTSYFHHSSLLEGYRGNFEDFCVLFLGGKVPFGSFWRHVLGFWEHRNSENILFLKYEDMKADLPSAITKTSNFLGRKLDNRDVEILANHLSFDSMKSNPSVNYEAIIALMREVYDVKSDGKFIRSGKVDQWKETMSEEMIQLFDQCSEDHFQGTGLKF